jgi:predicted TIM-barrel fold metal-dependent hydrolase
MIIDFHCHIGKDSDGGSLDFDSLKFSMDKWGIDKSVVFPFSGTHKEMVSGSLSILEKSKNDNWIIPFLRINPKDINEEELVKLFDKGFNGLKLHPSGQKFEVDSEDFFWIYEMCEKRKLPVLIHCAEAVDYAHPKRMINLSRKFPNLNIIMAHFFGNEIDLIDEAVDLPNLYTDTSIQSRTLRIHQAFYDKGYDRMLFASDTPYDSQGVALLKIRESNLKKKDEELILSGNAEKILRLNN